MKSENLRPNILFILSDQQRWDTLGCYGQKLNITPHLDKTAAQAVRFEYAFTPQPLCGPARACLQTGKYATETGCFRNCIALSAQEPTIAGHFGRVGYDLAYIGKWHLASTWGQVPDRQAQDYSDKAVPLERRGGWNRYWLASDALEMTSHSYDGQVFDADMKRVEFPQGRYRADCLTDFAIDYLRDRRVKEKPFFLFLSYLEPHHQNDHDRYEGPIGSKTLFADYEVPGDLREAEGDWRENYPDYLGCCAKLDENFGRLGSELWRQGLGENTLVVYTSDHGCHFKTRNSEYKRSCHDGCVRIPMIISGPGFDTPAVRSELVSLIDLPPTLLTAAGIEVPAEMQGRPLQPLVRNSVTDWPEDVFIQISESQVARALRTRRWKYAVCAVDADSFNDAQADVYREELLYDLENDPHERKNLIRDKGLGKVRQKLASGLLARMKQAKERIPAILPCS